MRLRELIPESFDKPFEWQHDDTTNMYGGKRIRYSFGSSKNMYHVNIHKDESTSNLVFHNQDDRIDNTHSEVNPQRVFSTVHHILKHHLSVHPEVKTVQFSGAKSTGRDKLYNHFARKFAHKHRAFDLGSGVEFEIDRKDMK